MNAYCYCITDTKYNKLYIGWHKGHISDGYFCSSSEVKKEYESRPQDFIKSIIATGSADDMFRLETSLLISEDAMSNPTYYNKSNNFGRECSNPTAGTLWWNDGKNEKRDYTQPGPEWNRGRLNVKIGGPTRFGAHTEESKNKMSIKARQRKGPSAATYGRICINNGVINKKIPATDTIPEGWVRGYAKKEDH